MASIFLGLGSNLGDRESYILQAISYLSPEVHVGQISSIYETEPVGYNKQPWFLNIACSGYTNLNPKPLLNHVKQIEKRMGRLSNFRNGPRIIDIDILIYDDLYMNTKSLTIPHPQLHERAFALAPLAELAPDIILHNGKKTIYQLLSDIGESQKLRKRPWSRTSANALLY